MSTHERQRAVDLVRRIVSGATETDAEMDALVEEFEALVPDPNASALIFWPQHHPLTKDLDPAELTPELIVEFAFRYKPFTL